MENIEIKEVTNKMLYAIDELVSKINCKSCAHLKDTYSIYPCSACIVMTDISCHWLDKAKPNFHHSFREADDYE